MAVKFGKFILLNKIALGGMAEVFKAKHIGVGGFEKIVAIKRILPHFSHNEEFITMFNEEAKVSAQLSHQNIVQIYEFGMVQNSYYIAMEYIDGVTINDLLIEYAEQDTEIPRYITLSIIRDACKGLDYAHRKKGFDNKPLNIVHRDISPKNIMVSFDGAVKVMDFGIAKAASRDYETRTGVIKGKISYLSPEQVQGARLDKRSDIFSLGIVLYEMLTGVKCFRGESDFSILFKIKNADIEPLQDFEPDIDEELDAIVMKALTANREERYQSCEEMALAIEKYLSNKHPGPAETDIGHFMRRKEEEYSERMMSLEEYFPQDNEEALGEVFALGADGTIPENIGSQIAEENLSQDFGEQSARVEEPVDFGTQVVRPAQLPIPEATKKRIFLPVFSVVLLIMAVGYYLHYRGILQLNFLPGAKVKRSSTPIVSQLKPSPPHPQNTSRQISYAIHLNSKPQGAKVMINGATLAEKTPLTVKGRGLENDMIEIVLSLPCYRKTSKKITLGDDIPETIDFTLQKATSKVTITSLPPGASVRVDKKNLGITPLTVGALDPCASHSLALSLKGYETLTRSSIRFDQPAVTFTLKRVVQPGTLIVKSTYPVEISTRSGNVIGQASPQGMSIKLKPGEYALVALSKKYCIRKAFSVRIVENQTIKHELTFGSLGKVRLISTPYSEVYINGFSLGTTPIQKVELPEGMYDVEWKFVTLGKSKKERLRVTRNIHQEWRGKPPF